MLWNKTDEYYEGTTKNFVMTSKVASFDLDQTLIDTKSGKKFPKDGNDWVWKYPNVPEKIKELSRENYSIMIISNQAGIVKDKKSGDQWSEKLDQIVQKLGIEMKVLCSIAKNQYRKPSPVFRIKFLPKDLDQNTFYCGDAVGRKGDFTDTDYKFALNANIDFKIPENVFLNQENKLPGVAYPIDIHKPCKKSRLEISPQKKEMLIMVGFPGSGKSSFSKRVQDECDYVVINQDTLKTKPKCIKATIKEMKEGNCVIIDATNPSKSGRKEWIELAKEVGFSVRIIKVDDSIEMSKHKNIYRAIAGGTKPVPDIAYNIYKSKYEEPEVSEGVKEVLKIKGGHPDDSRYYVYLF